MAYPFLDGAPSQRDAVGDVVTDTPSQRDDGKDAQRARDYRCANLMQPGPARGVPTARGAVWTPVQVSDILRRTR